MFMPKTRIPADAVTGVGIRPGSPHQSRQRRMLRFRASRKLEASRRTRSGPWSRTHGRARHWAFSESRMSTSWSSIWPWTRHFRRNEAFAVGQTAPRIGCRTPNECGRQAQSRALLRQIEAAERTRHRGHLKISWDTRRESEVVQALRRGPPSPRAVAKTWSWRRRSPASARNWPRTSQASR